jgi:hypothetical protein
MKYGMPELRHAITIFIGRRLRALSDLSDSVCALIQGVQYAFQIMVIITIIFIIIIYIFIYLFLVVKALGYKLEGRGFEIKF